ncbi:DBH-like monooxygenase protein 1 homolog [Antedon mediterranea]|uniref:DBH-like monooxygenase protein 1 homolog n=1 Tax=Antedon mediterranea TaxID=105859 RepID=UPI003AF6C7A2
MARIQVNIFSAILCICFVEALKTIDEKHEVVLNVEHGVNLKWRVDGEDILFEMSAVTRGYVAVGFSPNGGMPGSDIVVGWVNNGKAFVSDRYANDFKKPEADSSQDYELLYGYEKNGKTTIGFTRKLHTCDPKDYTITGDTSRIIWAINDNDPDKSDDLQYHRTARGVRSVVILDSTFKLRELPEDGKYFDMLMPNVSVPNDDTTYWCSPFLVPKFDKPVQVFRFDTIVQKGHEALVHHMIIYGCTGDYDSVSHWADLCIRKNMPPELEKCVRVIYAWAVGAGPFEFPEHVGLSLGGANDPTFMYIEMHYDNPERRSDFVDSSGLRLHYIPARREYDLDVWMVGEAFETKAHMIPPKETSFKTFGYCSGECTQASMKEDVKVFAVLLHGHLALRQINLQQYRNGTLISEVRDDNYDFNLQETRNTPEIIYKPGDDFVVTCSYDTMDRENITFGGIGTHEEMCLAFIYYYPRRANFTFCISNPTWDSISNEFGINTNNGTLIVSNITDITDLDGKELKDSLKEVAYHGARYEVCGFVSHGVREFPPKWFKDDRRIVKHEACAMTVFSGSSKTMGTLTATVILAAFVISILF